MLYQHYKGGLYEVYRRSVHHTETGERLVVYKDSNEHVWVRPYEMFHGMVEHEGRMVQRFTYIGG